jgi:hypothetical protein
MKYEGNVWEGKLTILLTVGNSELGGKHCESNIIMQQE